MSTLTNRARAIPRTLIGTTMNAARLPLTTLERVTGQRGNAEWPPAMAFETAEATVETVLGSLLRDDELTSRGQLRRTRLAKLREAAELETLARQERTQAADELEAKREQTTKRREKVEQSAEERERAIERRAEQREREVEKRASAQKQTVRKQASAAQKAVDQRERRARLDAMDAQAEAVDKERAALEAEEQAVAVDGAIEANREDRRSG